MARSCDRLVNSKGFVMNRKHIMTVHILPVVSIGALVTSRMGEGEGGVCHVT